MEKRCLEILGATMGAEPVEMGETFRKLSLLAPLEAVPLYYLGFSDAQTFTPPSGGR